jgi:hypothetical protein
LRVLVASIGMAVVARAVAARFEWSHPAHELWRIGAFALVGLAAVVSFLVFAALLRAPELSELAATVRRRRSRAT